MEEDYEDIPLCAECDENPASTPQGFCKECDDLCFNNSDS
jgi:hypothetical protein